MGLLSKLKRSLSRRSLKHPPRIEPTAEVQDTATDVPTPVSNAPPTPSSNLASSTITSKTSEPAATAAATSKPPRPSVRAVAAPAPIDTATDTAVAKPSPAVAPNTAAPKPVKPTATQDTVVGTQSAAGEASAQDGQAEEMNFFEATSRLFGRDNAERLTASKWSERNFAIASIHENLRGIGGGANTGTGAQAYSMEEFFCTTVRTVAQCVDDKVAPVFFSSMGLYTDLLDTYGSAVDAVQVREAITDLIPRLVTRMGSSNTRIQRQACDAILQTARCASLGGLAAVTPSLVTNTLPLRARLSVLRILVPETKLAKGTPLNLGAVMGVATPALRIADTKTRKAAVALVVACYKVSGRRVKRHLINIKPAMLKILHREFDAVSGGGGKPSSSSSSSGKSRRHRSSRRRKNDENAGPRGGKQAVAKRHASVGNLGPVSGLKSPMGSTAMKPPLRSRDEGASYLAPLPVSPMAVSRLNRSTSAPGMDRPSPGASKLHHASRPNFGAAESIFNLSGPAPAARSPRMSPVRVPVMADSMRAVAADPLEARFFDDDDEQMMDDILSCM